MASADWLIELGPDGNARILVDVPVKDAHWLRESSVFTVQRGVVGNTNIRAYTGVLSDPPLPDGAVDAVCVAQAFHWFDPQAALDEIARVLVPRGLLALLWNLWDLGEPGPALIEQIVAPLETGPIRHLTTASHPYGTWTAVLAADARFGPPETRRVRHAVALDADGAAARVASMSQVQAAAPADRGVR